MEYVRSIDLMTKDDTAVVVIDMQEKLLPAISQSELVIWNVNRIVDGAKILGLPVVATEQYPKGLGPTISPLKEKLGEIPDKLTFSCASCTQLFEDLKTTGKRRLLITGIETHVCVQQTVFDCLANGFEVYLAVDAVGSRYSLDKEIALRRMEAAGVTITTTESALFEWCERAGADEFKAISKLVREPAPSK